MEEREDVVMENRRERSERKRRWAESAWKNRRERRCVKDKWKREREIWKRKIAIVNVYGSEERTEREGRCAEDERQEGMESWKREKIP
jgi:hypothetical protein